MDIFERIVELRRAGQRAVLVTVVSSQGSTPRKPGARMLVYPDGRIEGTIGGGRVEHEVCAEATRVLQSGTTCVVEYKLTQQLAMCCGGQMSLMLEPVLSPFQLIVFGCGHVGRAVARMASNLDFEITLVDDLDVNIDSRELPKDCRIVDSFERGAVLALPYGPRTFVVIATREHSLDQRLLELCIDRGNAYLGVIGSERKAARQRARLEAREVASELIDEVRCPMGLAIDAETPAEIAVSVCAELVSTRRALEREVTSHGLKQNVSAQGQLLALVR